MNPQGTVGSPAWTPPIHAVEDVATFESKVRSGAVLVLFWSLEDRARHAFLYELECLAQEQRDTLCVLALEADEHPRLMARFQVQSLPTLFLFRDGDLVAARTDFPAGSSPNEWVARSLAGIDCDPQSVSGRPWSLNLPFQPSSVPDVMEPPCLPSSSMDVACLAHDQNNYLQVAFFRSDALRTHLENDPTGLECLDGLQQVLECMNSLNHRVLHEFRASRLSASRHSAIEEGADPDEVIQRTLALAESMNTKGVLIETGLAASWAPVSIPGIQLQQVVFNLLKNALEASPERGGKVVVESLIRPYTGRDSARDGWRALHITITDNGPGIPDGIRPRLFNGYSTSKKEGHGLGLHQVRKILGLYGGSISLDSSKGRGTRAIVVLPFK